MPYGLPDSIGGDSKENTAKMESCVRQMMQKGKSKSAAIAICKSSIIKARGNASIMLREALKIVEGE